MTLPAHNSGDNVTSIVSNIKVATCLELSDSTIVSGTECDRHFQGSPQLGSALSQASEYARETAAS